MSTLVTGHYTFFLYFCNLRNNIIRLSQKGRWIKVLYTETRSVEVIYLALWTDPEGDSCFSIYRISWVNCYPLIWWILNPDIHSFKGILFPGSWTPESGKFFLMESGILSFGIRNTAQWIQIPLTIGIRNPIFTDKIQYMCTLNPEPAAWESRIETVLDSLIGTSYVPKHNVTTIL